MDPDEDTTSEVAEALKDPESLERSIRSIRRYGENPGEASSKQMDRLGAIHHLANRVADEADDLEMNNVMSDEDLEQVEEVMRLSAWSSLVSMRLLTEEVIENSDNE